MRPSIGEALRMLDAADPTSTVELRPRADLAWQLFVDVRDDMVINEGVPPARRSTRPLLVAAAVAAVLVAALTLALTRRSEGSTKQPGQHPPSFATSSAQAREIGERFFAHLAAPSNSHPSTAKFGPNISCTVDCFIVTHTLSVPDGIHTALAFYSQHLPTGFAIMRRGATSLLIGDSTSSSDVAWLEIDMQAQGAQTGVRIDVAVPWYPPNRSTNEDIPTPASVIAAYGGDTLTPNRVKPIQRTLTEVQAQNAIAAMNSAPTWNPASRQTCTDLQQGTVLTLKATADGHRYEIRQFGGYCRVQLTRDGVAQPPLDVDLAPIILGDLEVPTH